MCYQIGPYLISAKKIGESHGIAQYGPATVTFLRPDGTENPADLRTFPTLYAAEQWCRGGDAAKFNSEDE